MFVVTKATAAPPSSRSAVRDRADASAAVPEESSDAAASTEPTLTWFDDRRYYVGRALPFFSSVSSIGGSVVQKRNSPWYPAVEAVAQSSPNLRVIHASLLPLATPEGGLLLSAFVNKFLVTLVPPHSDLSYVRTWYRRVGVPVAVEPAGGSGAPKVEARAGSPVPNAKGTPLSTRNTKAPPAVTAVSFDDEAVDLVLPYLDVLRAIDVLFNRSNGQATKWAFALCDLGETGFILKGTMQHLSTRDAALDTFAISEPVLNHRVVPEPKKPVGLGPTRVATTLTVEPSPDLTYTIVRAILQCFEHIAAKEVEVATAALGKKGKKGKKGAAPVLPSKRQFHINMQEFSAIMAIDPYVTSAFLPFIMKCAVNEEQPTRPPATAVAAPSPAPSDTTTSRRPPTTAPSDEGTTSAAPSRLGAATPAGVAALHTSPPIAATPQPAQPEAPPVPEH